MFVATFSLKDDYVLKSNIIGAYNTEVDAIKGLVSYLISKGCILCGFSDYLGDYYSVLENPSALDREILNWFNQDATEKLLFENEKQAMEEFVAIVAKHITNIKECKKFIEDHEDTYLNQTWIYCIQEISPK